MLIANIWEDECGVSDLEKKVSLHGIQGMFFAAHTEPTKEKFA